MLLSILDLSGETGPNSFPRSPVGMPSRTLPRPLPIGTATTRDTTRSVEDGIPTGDRGNENQAKIERGTQRKQGKWRKG